MDICIINYYPLCSVAPVLIVLLKERLGILVMLGCVTEVVERDQVIV